MRKQEIRRGMASICTEREQKCTVTVRTAVVVYAVGHSAFSADVAGYICYNRLNVSASDPHPAIGWSISLGYQLGWRAGCVAHDCEQVRGRTAGSGPGYSCRQGEG